MDKNPKWLVSSNAAGRDMVERQDGKYAFFMESATIEYITERFCNLTQIGGLLDNKGYGVATKKGSGSGDRVSFHVWFGLSFDTYPIFMLFQNLGSKLRGPLSEAILKLQETGVLQQLKDRWWKQKGGGQCNAKPAPALIELGNVWPSFSPIF